MTGLQTAHLGDAQIQGLADGTLRGPEGFEAREHVLACDHCRAELELYEMLSSELSTLADPPLPDDFTEGVLAAAGEREVQLEQRRHIYLAAIPAALLAVVSLVGWSLTAGPTQGLSDLVESFSVARQVVDVSGHVLRAAQAPLFLLAGTLTLVIGALLFRALREPSQVTPAQP